MTAQGDTTTETSADDLTEGTLISHLVELRNRLLKMFASVLLLFVFLVPWRGEIFTMVAQPLVEVLPGGQLIAVDPASTFITPVKLTLFVALFLGMPVVLYQIWAFVAPGLYRKEKRFAFPLLASSIALFYLGIAFAYYIVFPLVFKFFVAETPDDVEAQTDIARFVEFITTIIFAFGIAFEVPIATVLVVWTGLTSPEKLSKARPYVFLGAFVVGMFLTPPDIISQTLLAVPIYILFELGILMSRFFTTRKVATEAENEPSNKEAE